MKKFMAIVLAVLCLLALGAPSALSAAAAAAVEAAAPVQAASPAPDTSGKLYGIGSVSKVFTAAAVMKLVEQGYINLDEPVTTYIPEFAMADERYGEITPRMLLNHSSGLMGTTFCNAALLDDGDSYYHDHILDFLKTQTLKHAPGERSIYSNDSFTLSEILVERVSGVSFTAFIEREFSVPLGLTNMKTPQSEFDRNLLADIYLGNNALKPLYVGAIGSGGMYATVEDLCRFASIFMDDADGSVLSKESVAEMAKTQHIMPMTGSAADTVLQYGLGWDAVETYPFSTLGIKALSKGGSTTVYYSNLTVLPEHNMAAAVVSSGNSSMEQLIAQEILLAVLEEEGLIPGGTTLTFPVQNVSRAPVPDALLEYAGLYDMGLYGLYGIAFTEEAMVVTPVGVRNERPMEFIYSTGGKFESTNGDSFGVNSLTNPGSDMRGISSLAFFEGGQYLIAQTYEQIPGLSQTALAMPIAERLPANPVSAAAQAAWDARNSKEYLLVSEKYTSVEYLNAAIAKTLTDTRAPGYVLHGIYEAGGNAFPATKIADENNTLGYQTTPTMIGRDIVNLSITSQNGPDYLTINNMRYIDSAAAQPFSALGETIVIGSEPVWVNIDVNSAGKIIGVTTPPNGSWFVYDDKMNCIATSLEKEPRRTIALPENGRVAFTGEAGAVFTLQ